MATITALIADSIYPQSGINRRADALYIKNSNGNRAPVMAPNRVYAISCITFNIKNSFTSIVASLSGSR